MKKGCLGNLLKKEKQGLLERVWGTTDDVNAKTQLKIGVSFVKVSLRRDEFLSLISKDVNREIKTSSRFRQKANMANGRSDRVTLFSSHMPFTVCLF